MPGLKLFPSVVWQARAPASMGPGSNFLKQIAREAQVFRSLDSVGQKWSQANYARGYTSYGSIVDLPHRSTTFEKLSKWIDREAKQYAQALELDLQKGRLEMGTCWINIMGEGCTHSSHLHPYSTLSGTFYVQVPKGSGVLKLEDPRLPMMMASPPRKESASKENQRFVSLNAQPGGLILFESWIKHEVPPNPSHEERVSISFNYDWIK